MHELFRFAIIQVLVISPIIHNLRQKQVSRSSGTASFPFQGAPWLPGCILSALLPGSIAQRPVPGAPGCRGT